MEVGLEAHHLDAAGSAGGFQSADVGHCFRADVGETEVDGDVGFVDVGDADCVAGGEVGEVVGLSLDSVGVCGAEVGRNKTGRARLDVADDAFVAH